MITDTAAPSIYATGAGGPPVTHHVTFTPAGPVPGFRPPAERVTCTCGDARTLDGPLSDAKKERYCRQHEGTPDP